MSKCQELNELKKFKARNFNIELLFSGYKTDCNVSNFLSITQTFLSGKRNNSGFKYLKLANWITLRKIQVQINNFFFQKSILNKYMLEVRSGKNINCKLSIILQKLISMNFKYAKEKFLIISQNSFPFNLKSNPRCKSFCNGCKLI